MDCHTTDPDVSPMAAALLERELRRSGDFTRCLFASGFGCVALIATEWRFSPWILWISLVVLAWSLVRSRRQTPADLGAAIRNVRAIGTDDRRNVQHCLACCLWRRRDVGVDNRSVVRHPLWPSFGQLAINDLICHLGSFTLWAIAVIGMVQSVQIGAGAASWSGVGVLACGLGLFLVLVFLHTADQDRGRWWLWHSGAAPTADSDGGVLEPDAGVERPARVLH